MSIGFVDVENVVHFANGEGQRGFFVVVTDHFDIIDDCVEEV